MQSGKFIDFSKVCKCGMLCLNVRSVAVYNSAVVEFWPFLLKQRMKLYLLNKEESKEFVIDYR